MTHRAQGPVLVPASVPLIFEIGGNVSPEIFQYNWVVKKLNPKEFTGLKIVGPKNIMGNAGSPEQKDEILLSDGVVQILSIASKWPDLTSMILDSVTPVEKMGTTLNNFPHLERLKIAKSNSLATKFVEQPFIQRLQDLWLNQIPADNMLLSISTSRNLRILTLENCNVSPESFHALQHCSHLQELYLEGTPFNDQTIKSICGIKSLKTLLIGNAGITTGQQKMLAQANIELLRHKRVWGIH